MPTDQNEDESSKEDLKRFRLSGSCPSRAAKSSSVYVLKRVRMQSLRHRQMLWTARHTTYILYCVSLATWVGSLNLWTGGFIICSLILHYFSRTCSRIDLSLPFNGCPSWSCSSTIQYDDALFQSPNLSAGSAIHFVPNFGEFAPHLLGTLGLSSCRRRWYDVTTDGRGFQSLFVVIILRVISPTPGLRPNSVHKTWIPYSYEYLQRKYVFSCAYKIIGCYDSWRQITELVSVAKKWFRPSPVAFHTLLLQPWTMTSKIMVWWLWTMNVRCERMMW